MHKVFFSRTSAENEISRVEDRKQIFFFLSLFIGIFLLFTRTLSDFDKSEIIVFSDRDKNALPNEG